jgi:HAD superfamily phosphatase (TIGR01668 family)
MGRFLFPDEYYDSTYSIDFKKYYDMGYRGVLFDIDNTLVEHNAMADERSIKLINELKNIGFGICFVSNNKKQRVADFNADMHVRYVFKADKPSAKGYLKAMKRLNTNKENTIFVGDQLFTDIWGANNAHIHSILVKQIARHEEIQIILKRILEKPIIWLYTRKHKMKKKSSGN